MTRTAGQHHLFTIERPFLLTHSKRLTVITCCAASPFPAQASNKEKVLSFSYDI
jgi:hypothetical protein